MIAAGVTLRHRCLSSVQVAAVRRRNRQIIQLTRPVSLSLSLYRNAVRNDDCIAASLTTSATLSEYCHDCRFSPHRRMQC